MLVENLLKVSLLGATWVMYLLLVLSVLSLGVVIERWLYFRKKATGPDDLGDHLAASLSRGDVEGAEKLLARTPSVEAEIILPSLASLDGGADAVSDAIESRLARKRKELEKGLSFLGTVGSNAPFIGLFGTVIGVIEAFAHLGAGQNQEAMAKVMAGIAEALVATGVGLFVAIPAVVFFNLFQKRVAEIEESVTSLSKRISSILKSPAPAHWKNGATTVDTHAAA